MPYYVVLGKWTDQARRAVKDTAKRFAGFKAAVEGKGAKVAGAYFPFTGDYDFILVIEQASSTDENMMVDKLTALSKGFTMPTFVKAFSVEELEKITEKLP